MAMASCGSPMRKRRRAAYEPKPRYMHPIHTLFLWEGAKTEVEKKRLEIYTGRYSDKGGWMMTDVGEETTHIISNDFAAVLTYFWDVRKCPQQSFKKIKCVSYKWLAACLQVRALVPEKFFRIDLHRQPGCELARFRKACGEIDESTGKWQYDPALAAAVVLEDESEVIPEEKDKDSGNTGKELEVDPKDSSGPKLGFPPWIVPSNQRRGMPPHEFRSFTRNKEGIAPLEL